MSLPFKWKRFGGYECSSKGDKRFSAFNAIMPDGRSIEEIYQCDPGGKGYDPGGRNWKLGKGKPPVDGKSREALWSFYLDLWRIWAKNNLPLMRELYHEAKLVGWTLSDRYATTDINQAHALSIILNELSNEHK